MKAIIVDDEPKAIELISSYLSHFNSIELVTSFRNGLKAFEYISKQPVDLVFLDINMPHISGIFLSKMLPKHIKIIFTTAYSEFAVESYEIQAIDYLMKPISLERFTKSISRVLSTNEQLIENKQKVVLVKSGFETYRLLSEDILYLEKDSNYVNYHCENQKIMARETIQESLAKLPDIFIQSHKSYIINIEKIVSYDKNFITIAKSKIPISDSFRSQLFEVLEKY